MIKDKDKKITLSRVLALLRVYYYYYYSASFKVIVKVFNSDFL